MALRVLLADESSTIKKVLQLALSDMGVEVKSVPSGLDVISVALDFRPEIIFADILLTKKNGYEVCQEIKKHPSLKLTPVVLMWSSFMEFDHKQANLVGCNGQLEKPFDTESLRSLVNKLVVKTQTHPLKGLLEFPALPEFLEASSDSKNNLYPDDESEESIEDYTFANLKKPAALEKMQPASRKQVVPEKKSPPQPESFAIQLETENYGEFEEVILVKSEPGKEDLEHRIQDQLKNYLKNSPVALNKIQNQKETAPVNRFDEQLIREEVRQMAEKICWQVIPEITEKIVREELKKLLSDIDKSI